MKITLKLIMLITSLGCMSHMSDRNDMLLLWMAILVFGWAICSLIKQSLNVFNDTYSCDYRTYGNGNGNAKVYGNRYSNGTYFGTFSKTNEKELVKQISKKLKLNNNASIVIEIDDKNIKK